MSLATAPEVVSPTPPEVTNPAAADAPSARTLRLMLSPAIGQGALDGAWWPHSRDLRVEALDLVNHFPDSHGRVFRLLYATADWIGGPGRFRADHVIATLACFPHDDTHRVLLRTDQDTRVIQLLVVPPEWDERRANRAMRQAAMPTNRESAAGILAAG